MMKKINVLHIISGIGIGGAEKVVFDLSRFADTTVFDVTVLVTGLPKAMLPDFEKNNISLQFLQHRQKGWRVGRVLRKIRQAFQMIRELHQAKKIDIIHAHMGGSGILAAFIKLRFPHTKVVFTSHNYVMDSKIEAFLLYLTKKCRSADIIFSKEMASQMYRNDAVIIPNGILTKEYELNLPKFTQFTFVCIGRLTKQKNQLGLIQSLGILKSRGYQFQLLFVGEGNDRQLIEKEIAAYDLQHQVKLLGIRKDIPKICNQAHCLVMPSLWEGLPIVLLEAGASNLPVIATNVGSIASLINNEELGYLVNNIEELVQKMAEFMDNYNTAKRKGQNLKQKVNAEYDIKYVVQQHELVYARLA